MNKSMLFVVLSTIIALTVNAQPGTMEIMNSLHKLNTQLNDPGHRFDIIEKQIDDVQWYTGSPLAVERNPTGQGAGNAPFRNIKDLQTAGYDFN